MITLLPSAQITFLLTLNSAQAQRPSKFYKRCLSIALSIPGATKSISPHRHRLKNSLQV
jgi:hypothetical protein